MRTLTTKPLAVLLALAFFALTCVVGPSTAEARWHDHSDELPGSDFPTTLVVVGGVAAAGLIAVLLLKKGGKDEVEEPVTDGAPADEATDDTEASTSQSHQTGSYKATTSLAPQELSTKLGLYYDCDQGGVGAGPKRSLSDLRVKVGVSLSF